MKQLYPPRTLSETCETPSNNGKNKKQTTIKEDSKILLRRKGAIEKNHNRPHTPQTINPANPAVYCRDAFYARNEF